MSKLVDKERLALLAKALDDRMKAAVAAEKDRAEVVEARIEGKADANAQAIAAINNENTGVLKQAKDYADGQVAVEKQRAEGIEAGLKGRIETLENKFTGEGSVASQIAEAVGVEKARAEGQEAAIRSEFAAVDTTIRSEMATMKSDLQKEIDADVKVVSDELANQKNAEFVGGLANQIKVENERAVAKEGELAQAIAGEKSRAEGKEGELLAAINKEVQDRQQADQGLASRLSVVEGILDPKEEGQVGFEDVVAKLEELEAEDADIRTDFAAVDAAIRKEFADADAALQASMEEVLGEFNTEVSGSLVELGNAIGEVQTAVEDEKERAEGEEAKIRGEFAAADTALHTQISAEIDADVKAAVDAQKLVDAAQDESLEDHKGRIEALEARFGEGTGTVESQIAKVQKEVDDLEGVVGGIDSVVKDHTTKLTGLKKETVQGAIDEAKNEAMAKAVELDLEMNERMASVEGKLNKGGAIESRIAKNETDIAGHAAKIAKFEGDAQTAGSIAEAKAVADYAKEQIDAFMDANAVKEGTINTLKEIQLYIEEHGEDAAGMVDDIAANAKAIADEASRAAGQEALIREELADEAAEIRGEVETKLGKWEVIEEGGAVSQERSGLRGEIEDRFDQLAGELAPMLEGIIQDYQDKDAALKSELQAEIAAEVKEVADALAKEKDPNEEGTLAKLIATEMIRAMEVEGDITSQMIDNNKDRIAEEVRIEGKVDAEVDRATKAEAALGVRIDEAIEECEEMDRLRQASIDGLERFEEETRLLLGEKSGLDVFGDPKEATGLCKDVEDNTKAIEQEVKDRQTAITTALESYSTTEEMKAVIGNVVNSLALTMENDKVVLKLGGVDGIALASVSLDVATEADIQGILDGLDA